MSDRANKARSLALDPKAARDPSSMPRPKGTRTNSVPTVDKRQSAPPRSASKARKPVAADRDSKVSQRTTRSEPAQPTSRQSRGDGRGLRQSEDVPHVNLVVLGVDGVDKSTFIQRALDLRSPSSGPASSSRVSLDGAIYRCQLWEFLLDDVEYGGETGIVWPKFINASPVPQIDGVLCLYDTGDRESLAQLLGLLRVLSRSPIPHVSLVATRGDKASTGPRVEPSLVVEITSAYPSLKTSDAYLSSAESQKRCLLSALRSVLAANATSSKRQPTHPAPAGLPSASDREVHDRSRPKQASARQSRSNSRAPITARPGAVLYSPSSEESGIDDNDQGEDSDTRALLQSYEDKQSEHSQSTVQPDTTIAREPLHVDTHSSSRNMTRPNDPQTPLSSTDQGTRCLASPFHEDGSRIPQTPDSFVLASRLRSGTGDTDNQAGQTFLDLEDESQDGSSENEIEKSTSSLEPAPPKIKEPPKPETGYSFDELVDRLLKLPMAKQQPKYVAIFLCLYRAFATPKQLLQAVISRFDDVGNSEDDKLSKAGEQLRYLGVLTQWTADYPGDFTDASTRQLASVFVQRLEKSKIFRHAAKELSNDLTVDVDDDDEGWAYADPADPPAQQETTLTGRSTKPRVPQSPTRVVKRAAAREDDDDPDSEDDNTDADEKTSARNSGTPSTSASSYMKPTNASSQSLTNLWKMELARDKAQKLRSVPRVPLSKMQWHQFMETPAVDFAIEVTRIDWTMYSAIRPRDFIRHVMSKQKSKTTDNIGAMVKHFNHLAVFVSGMILLRDKPKHRARALEKFMTIAWKVRQMNDYNSLGAIVAGINGHEIHRLTQTRDLVPQSTLKDFMRLTILMSHSRSHSAYRMAWENSFSARIPFLPLLRQDLTMAQTGSRTFVGSGNDKINWKKFEIMGDVVYSIQKSQEQPYTVLQYNEEIERLILDTKILNGSEDSADPRSELYDRSVQLEPVGAGGDPSRKKFDWFRR